MDAVIHLVGIVPVARPGYEVIGANACCYDDAQLPLHYLTIDEDHAVQATDVYRLSKQEMQTIGRSFGERDRISSVMVRIPSVPSHEAVLAGLGARRRHDGALVDRLLAMDDRKLAAAMERPQGGYNRFHREHRADVIECGEWVTDDPDLTLNERHFMD